MGRNTLYRRQTKTGRVDSMSGPEFFQTPMGRHYYERQLPEQIKAMNRLAEAIEKQNESSTKKDSQWPTIAELAEELKNYQPKKQEPEERLPNMVRSTYEIEWEYKIGWPVSKRHKTRFSMLHVEGQEPTDEMVAENACHKYFITLHDIISIEKVKESKAAQDVSSLRSIEMRTYTITWKQNGEINRGTIQLSGYEGTEQDKTIAETEACTTFLIHPNDIIDIERTN